MKFRSKERVFFFQLEESIFNRLKYEIAENNTLHPKGDKHIKLDIAGFFLSLIDKRRALLGEDAKDGYVPLMSSILKKYYYDYKRYIEFLREKEFIEVIDGYSTFTGKSKQYRIVPSYKPYTLIQWIPKDVVFSRKIRKMEARERSRADRSCGHLTKWLHPQYLSVQYSEANQKVDEEMYRGNYSEGHYSKRKQKIELLEKGYISYKREGKDNRLHSILTNLPKDLRPYLLFQQEEQLISLDLKSSQPFMLAGFINLALENKRPEIDIVVSKILGSSRRNAIRDIIMWKENLTALDITELKAYQKIVLQDDIYDYIGRNLSSEFVKKKTRFGGIRDKFYSKYSGVKKWKSFKNLRDFSKVALLEYLYSSENNSEERLNEVKQILPNAVNELVRLLKKDCKADFPIFLQNLESFFIIDEITKKFARRYPKAPLYTIHDSVATTEEYSQALKEALEKDLFDFFGIKPNVLPENWCESSSEAA